MGQKVDQLEARLSVLTGGVTVSLAERLEMVELARIFIPPHTRFRDGKKQDVEGYWRTLKNPADIDRVGVPKELSPVERAAYTGMKSSGRLKGNDRPSYDSMSKWIKYKGDDKFTRNYSKFRESNLRQETNTRSAIKDVEPALRKLGFKGGTPNWVGARGGATYKWEGRDRSAIVHFNPDTGEWTIEEYSQKPITEFFRPGHPPKKKATKKFEDEAQVIKYLSDFVKPR